MKKFSYLWLCILIEDVLGLLDHMSITFQSPILFSSYSIEVTKCFIQLLQKSRIDEYFEIVFNLAMISKNNLEVV